MNKKLLSYIFILIFVLVLLLIIPSKVFASEDTIYSIVMDIEITNDGTAKVVEKWDTDINSGTELFKQYNNLETSTIENFTVTENGTKYQVLSSWDTSASQIDKKNKCGINKTSAGVELCWGIGDYGRHEYVLEYEIANFIYEYNDSQVSNFILIPDLEDLTPKYVKIALKAFFKIEAKDVSIALTGFSGNYSIKPDGTVEIYSNGTLKSGEYVNVDLSFADNKFSLTNKSVSLTTGSTSTKANTRAKKIFVTLCGIFALFIIANRMEQKKKLKEEVVEPTDEDTK